MYSFLILCELIVTNSIVTSCCYSIVICYVSCGVRDKIKEYHLSISSMDVVKATKGLIGFIPEIDCDQTASLPPVTSTV
jgi:hypothetical protein